MIYRTINRLSRLRPGIPTAQLSVVMGDRVSAQEWAAWCQGLDFTHLRLHLGVISLGPGEFRRDLSSWIEDSSGPGNGSIDVGVNYDSIDFVYRASGDIHPENQGLIQAFLQEEWRRIYNLISVSPGMNSLLFLENIDYAARRFAQAPDRFALLEQWLYIYIDSYDLLPSVSEVQRFLGNSFGDCAAEFEQYLTCAVLRQSIQV